MRSKGRSMCQTGRCGLGEVSRHEAWGRAAEAENADPV